MIEAVIPNLDAFRQGMQQQLLIAPSQIAVASAMAQMRQIGTSCVLVVDQTQILGIFTERDAVRAIVADVCLDTTPISEWLTPRTLTLSASEIENSFTVLARFGQSAQHPLPVLNLQGHPIGMITPQLLQQSLSAPALLQPRQAHEVMSRQISYATPTTSVAQLIQWMVEHSLQHLVIIDAKDGDNCLGRMALHTATPCWSIGLVTDQTIIQAQLSGQDMTKIPAQAVMQPLVSVAPSASLWFAHQQMQQLGSSCLAVIEASGAMVGVVTQADLLRVFDPAEMYRVIIAQQAEIPLNLTNTTRSNSSSPWVPQPEKPPSAANPISIREELLDLNRLEIALQQSQIQLHDILDSAVASVVRARVFADGSFEYDFISSGCAAIFGYTAEEFMADQTLWLSRMHPEDAKRVASHWLDRILAEETFTVEYRFFHKDGTLRWVSTAHASRRHTVSHCWVVTIVDHDITERQQTEAQLRQNEAKLREAQRVAQLGSWEFNAITHTVVWSEEVFHIFGFDPTQPEPSLAQFLRQCHPDDQAFVQNCLRQATQVDGFFETDFRIIRPDRSIRYLATKGEREFDGAGNLIRLFGTVQDITDRKQTEAMLQQQADRERFLGEISQRIRQSLELNEILKITVSEIRHLLQTDRVLLYRIEPNLSGTVVEESVAPEWMPLLHRNIRDRCLAETYIQQYKQGLMTAKADIYNSDTQPCHIEFLEKFHIKANLVIPIFRGESLWGLLIVHQCSAPRHWQAWETTLLQQLATQVGIALQQSELYQQVRRLNLTLENQVQERTADLQRALNFEALLKRITDKVRDSLDERQILQTAVAELANGLLVNCCNAALYQLEHNTTTICYEHIRSSDFVSLTGVTASLEQSAGLHHQLLQGNALQFCSLFSFPTQDPNVFSTNHHLAILACPIVDDQGVLGDLWLFKPKLASFNDQEVRLVQQVANQCAIALRQSRLYQSSRSQVQELERLNHLKDDFLSTVPHELRTPVTNIKMATQMLEIGLKQLGVLNDPTTPVYRYFQILKDECQREINLINDLLDLTRLDAEAAPLTLTTIDLDTLIARIVEPFRERTRNQRQHLHLHLPDCLPPMTTDPSSIERILSELLQNACKYTPAGENITLCAQVVQSWVKPEKMACSRDALLISICNTGVEIPASERDRVFEKFYRIPNNDPWRHGGTGLGLALVKKLVDRLDGTIQLESQHCQVTFKALLPLETLNASRKNTEP